MNLQLPITPGVYRTRGGRIAEITTVDPSGEYPILGAVRIVHRWMARGWFRDVDQPSPLDLVSRIEDTSELLTALEGLLADWERVHGAVPEDHEARAAIAKARGGADARSATDPSSVAATAKQLTPSEIEANLRDFMGSQVKPETKLALAIEQAYLRALNDVGMKVPDHHAIMVMAGRPIVTKTSTKTAVINVRGAK
jgi:hypothetical protein